MIEETDISTKDIKIIQNSGYFDADYYLANYKEELGEDEKPLEHFLHKGWQEGKNPSEKFNVRDYLKMYPEVQEVSINPLLHYLHEGKNKGYLPSQFAEEFEFIYQAGEFDEEYYLKHNKDIAFESESPLQHFMRIGWKEGRNPNASFDVNYYLSNYPDVKESDLNPFFHHVRFGKPEGRFPSQLAEEAAFVRESGLFDVAYYKEQARSIAENEDPVEHFLRYGWLEELNPSENFNIREYLFMHGDEVGEINPLLHYLRVGKEKGYRPNQFSEELRLVKEVGIFDDKYYLEQYSEEIDTDEDPLYHFMRVGWKKDFNPTEEFDIEFYITTYKVESNPLIHYLQSGIKQRYIPSPKFLDMYLPEDFDAEKYLKLNPDIDIKANGESAICKAMWHYLKVGKNENRSYYFDHNFYTSFYTDLSGFKGKSKALDHWLKHGHKEKRCANLGSYLNTLKVDTKPLMKVLEGSKLQELNPDMDVTNPAKSLISVLNQTPPIALSFFDNAEDNYHLYFQIALNFEKQFVQTSERLLKLEKEKQTLEKEKQQMLEKAEDTYHIALMFRANPLCYENLGNLSLNGGKLHQAIEYYYEAISCKTKSQWPYTNLADALMRVNRPAEAIYVINDAIDYFSPNPHLLPLLERSINSYWAQEEERFVAMAKRPNRQDSIEAMASAIQTVAKAYRRRFMSNTKLPASASLNKESILIIGDYHIPQCIRYRIEQKREQLEQAGFKVTTVPWTKNEDMQKELYWHDIIIFYRVPAIPSVIKIIEQAGALGKLRFYEIDDLLFEPIYPPAINSYGGYVTPKQYLGLIKSMPLMHEAAHLCDYAIASTKPLLKHLEPLVLQKKGFLHRNALDSLNLIVEPNFTDKDKLAPLTIFYGSGTLAHNSDFILEALPAIERILAKYTHVSFFVAGHLKLPEKFLAKYKERTAQVPLSDLNLYWSYLARADINLAVLHQDTINDCKSELKWFEAACFGIPSVVSRTQNYLDVIQDGKDGFVVSGVEQWYDSLDLLVNDLELRKSIGLAAQERVKEEYSLSRMAQNIAWIVEQALEDFQNR